MNDAMLSQMMKAVSAMLPPEQEPDNPVAKFVDVKVLEMIPDPEIAKLFKIALVDYCNKAPDTALEVLVALANDVARLVVEIVNETEDTEVDEAED